MILCLWINIKCLLTQIVVNIEASWHTFQPQAQKKSLPWTNFWYSSKKTVVIFWHDCSSSRKRKKIVPYISRWNFPVLTTTIEKKITLKKCLIFFQNRKVIIFWEIAHQVKKRKKYYTLAWLLQKFLYSGITAD